MTSYALWNNKGGVGKSYLAFQIASEYARSHPEKHVLVLDMCPQANVSSMLLGGIVNGEAQLETLSMQVPPRTIAGYIESRILSPYVNPRTGANFLTRVNSLNSEAPPNLHLVCGDEALEIQASRVSSATNPGPENAWQIVHLWLSDLIADVSESLGESDLTVFIDCNPSFSIYTELALSAADRLIVPFTADGSSKRAVKAVLALVYGVGRHAGALQSEFFIRTTRYRMNLPQIYCYVGNRLTTFDSRSASGFKAVVNEIRDEIYDVWLQNPNHFCIHPSGAGLPGTRATFTRMFQYEVPDANTASVVSTALGIPIMGLRNRPYRVLNKDVQVNQSQLDRQQPNLRALVSTIE